MSPRQAPRTVAQNAEADLAADIGSFVHDPLGFVRYCFPWGEGDLKDSKGPRPWQVAYLEDVTKKLQAGTIDTSGVIQQAVSSGHGIGKSALVSWLIWWGISTFEDTRGVVTANTEQQLKQKTWAELSKWARLAVNSHWFKPTATSLYSADPKHEKTWRIDMLPWSEPRPESFAGLHNKGKRILIIFDEASAIPDIIWETVEGALTDEGTEIIWAVFGNPTRNTGRFKECFNLRRHRWQNWTIDSRTVDGTNKVLFQQWIEDWGEDSDFVRVRVRGLFPRASSLQFIGSDAVFLAQTREAISLLDDPLIGALDIARGGADNNVLIGRRGCDARSIDPIIIPGSETRDTMRLVSVVVDWCDRNQPDAFFLDATGVGGPIGDRLRQLGYVVIDVQFGSSSPNPKQANMRAYMWQRLKEALGAGLAIPRRAVLETDLTSVEYSHNAKDQLLLESKDSMKARGLASPDEGDALAMTYAYPVVKKGGRGPGGGRKPDTTVHDFDPLESAA